MASQPSYFSKLDFLISQLYWLRNIFLTSNLILLLQRLPISRQHCDLSFIGIGGRVRSQEMAAKSSLVGKSGKLRNQVILRWRKGGLRSHERCESVPFYNSCLKIFRILFLAWWLKNWLMIILRTSSGSEEVSNPFQKTGTAYKTQVSIFYLYWNKISYSKSIQFVITTSFQLLEHFQVYI